VFKNLRNINWSELSGLLVGAALAVIICIGAIMLVLKLEAEGILWKYEYTLYSDLATGQGLGKGTKVQINGVNVGTVKEISLAEQGTASAVRLELTIDTVYKKWITNKSIVFATRDQNIISERVLNIDISQRGDKILEHGDILKAGTAQDIETVLKTANELIASISALIIVGDSLLKLAMDTSATIGMLLGSRILYDQLDFAVRNINGLLKDVGGVVDDVDGMVKTMSSGVPKAMAFADTLSTNIMGVMGKAGVMMNSLDSTLRNVSGLVDDLAPVVGSVGNLLTDGSQAINKTDDLVGGVSKFWFIRGKIPKKDTIPLLEDAW